MLASHLVEVNELSPPQLCHYIEQKHYLPIRQSLAILKEYAEKIQHAEVDTEKLGLASMLYIRLMEEMEQVIRNDMMILFPLMMQPDKKATSSNIHIPVQMIRDKNKKILNLLERLRSLANNFILKPEWDTDTRFFFEELFSLDQMVSQAIYLKENVLLPKMLKVGA
jgi:iron-sulfur cluster repair protein YtfE (RIC family)